MSSTATLLEVESLTTGYGSNEVVHEFSMTLDEGNSVCIIGPNGAGKSTILKAIAGYLPCWGGEIYFHGEDITQTPPEQLVHHGVSIVPQGRVVFPDMTIKEHLDLGAWTTDAERKREALDDVYELFPYVENNLKKKAGDLSGGQQQMVSFARALMIDPDLLILDEPSLGLAPQLVTETFEMIEEIEAIGVSILMVEQNAARALEHTDSGIVVDKGRVAFQDESAELLSDPEVRDIYLGM